MTENNMSDRHLALCGWLREHHPDLYNNPRKCAYFLFLYEAVSHADGDPDTDFRDLAAESL